MPGDKFADGEDEVANYKFWPPEDPAEQKKLDEELDPEDRDDEEDVLIEDDSE
jgi:hypothetical protein